nr:callose synthase 1 [Quercus suber]
MVGHGFAIRHGKAMEIIIILIYFKLVAQDFNTVVSSSILILVASRLYIPFIFNPFGFSWNKIVEDWEDWIKWLYSLIKLGISATDSWKIWWYEEQEHLRSINIMRRVTRIIILALRFFTIQYGFVELVA